MALEFLALNPITAGQSISVWVQARLLPALLAAVALLAGCDDNQGGPIEISAIGNPPALVNPNLQTIDPPAAFLAGATAQGLVRFEATGQIEPALAQRWIVSDDGLRYTFRLARAEWSSGGRVTAEQVVARIRAAMGPTSRNPLKPLLGAIDEVVAMTDDVLEISLKSPRPNFLQLLAQPELAIIRNGSGSGPHRAEVRPDGALRLSLPDTADEDAAPRPSLRLRGESAALATVRFREGRADLVTGGTIGDLIVARSGRVPAQAYRYDPVAGLFGLVFVDAKGALADARVRDALAMAIDRTALVAALGVPGLQPRESLLVPGTDEVPRPALPAWAGQALPARRTAAARTLATSFGGAPATLRVALPAGPGYRIIFAHLRRDWRAIGIMAEAVALDAPADLRLIDRVAPVTMASWYLRSFTCSANALCSAEADQAMDAARIAPTRQERIDRLIEADRLLRDTVPFISLTAPVRWSLVSSRLTGFRPNVFGRHPPGDLIAPRR